MRGEARRSPRPVKKRRRSCMSEPTRKCGGSYTVSRARFLLRLEVDDARSHPGGGGRALERGRPADDIRGSRRGHAPAERIPGSARAARRAAAGRCRARPLHALRVMTTRDDDLAFTGAAKLAAMVRDKQVSPVELVRLYLDRIDRF